MRILVTGANGFIGGYVVAHLLMQKHQVICCVRSVNKTRLRFSNAEVVHCDFNKDVSVSDWLPRLQGVDAVINCVGVLTGSRRQNINRIHYQSPLALFKACEQLHIKRVVQLSALGVQNGPDIDYVCSKRQVDEALLNMNVSACVLRPSLVLANGAYGGSALIRALSALPGIMPVIGRGEFCFQPLAMFDLVRVIETFLNHDYCGVIDVVGPKKVSIKEIQEYVRRWLGIKKAKIWSCPLWLIRRIVKIGDWFGFGPLNSVSYQMTLHENVGDYRRLRMLINFDLRPFPELLSYYPCQTQDKWHARLYFLNPLMTATLASLWSISGMLPLFFYQREADQLLMSMGFSERMSFWGRLLSCFWDLFIALGVFVVSKRYLMGIVQITTIVVYTLLATVGLPSLWLNPLGPLVKNIPITLAVLVWMALTDER